MNQLKEREEFLLRVEELRPKTGYEKDHKQCCRCRFWIHPDMVDCQPCIAANPMYSMLHTYK